jgi:hypothetical protein
VLARHGWVVSIFANDPLLAGMYIDNPAAQAEMLKLRERT